jgi:hypothetical protein
VNGLAILTGDDQLDAELAQWALDELAEDKGSAEELLWWPVS